MQSLTLVESAADTGSFRLQLIVALDRDRHRTAVVHIPGALAAAKPERKFDNLCFGNQRPVQRQLYSWTRKYTRPEAMLWAYSLAFALNYGLAESEYL